MKDHDTPRSSSSGYRSISSLSTTHSQCLSLQRKRTLDEFPMKHSYVDTIEMLRERRKLRDDQLQKTKGSDKTECKELRTYGKEQFDSALNLQRGRFLSVPGVPETVQFSEGDQATWAQRRHHSLQSSSSLIPRNLQRPSSEPPTAVGQTRTFNHLRSTKSAYPRIQKHLQHLNTEYRVICTAPPEVCQQRRLSKDLSVASEFFLVPLEEDAVSEEDVQTVAEEVSSSWASSVKLEPSFHSNPLESETKVPREEVQESSEKGVEEVEQGCWVDYATVSSVDDHSMKGEPTEGDLISSIGPEESPQDLAGEPVETAQNLPAATSSTSKEQPQPATPAVKSSRQLRKKSPVGSGKKPRRKTPEPVEKPPTPPPPPPPEPEVVETAIVPPKPEPEPEPEPKPEPVPPSVACPSSETWSRHIETKRWLKNSSFSAANRNVPIFS